MSIITLIFLDLQALSVWPGERQAYRHLSHARRNRTRPESAAASDDIVLTQPNCRQLGGMKDNKQDRVELGCDTISWPHTAGSK